MEKVYTDIIPMKQGLIMVVDRFAIGLSYDGRCGFIDGNIKKETIEKLKEQK